MPNRLKLGLIALTLGGLPSLALAQEAATADAAQLMSEDAIQLLNWVIASGDNRGRPFIVIDKIAAAVFVFGAEGQFLDASPALLGVARGDDSVPGIGDRKLSAISPFERTTPAGRFVAGFGPGLGFRQVLWVDYASSIALHPVVSSNKKERRLQRLQSPSSEDNRITYGCINVSASFFKAMVRTLPKTDSGFVYILPETKPLNEVFPAFRPQEQASLQVTFGR